MKISEQARVVITGAGSGLGRAFCVELAARGAKIVAGDVNLAGLEETRALLNGAVFHAVSCDVAKLEDVQKLSDVAHDKLGGVDLVVNNAGVATGGLVGEVPIEDWRWIVGINLMGVVHGCHVFVPQFRAQSRGGVLNVASAAGLISAPSMAPYNATKAGVVALTEALHAELVDSGVHCTVLCPTFFRTNIGKSARGTTANDSKMLDRLMDRASLQADGVAKFALDALDRGDLYALPHADGRWFWRLKRLAPGVYDRIVGMGGKRMFGRK
ncbi:MAG: SDR family NAD(P)-dependent oxidoreductase [Polyangiales bacterium]